jgi:DNA-binding response OmpR family regulator
VVEGLGCGADDYMVKPCPRELVARVNVALMKAGKAILSFESQVYRKERLTGAPAPCNL